MPLTGSVITFIACKKVKIKFKKAKCVSNRCKDYLSEKNILGLGAL